MSYFYAILKGYDFGYSTIGNIIFVVIYFKPLYALFARIEEYAMFLLPVFLEIKLHECM